jgi:hypothetical protein
MKLGDKSLFCQFVQTQRLGIIAVHKPFGLTDLDKDILRRKDTVPDFGYLLLVVGQWVEGFWVDGVGAWINLTLGFEKDFLRLS